ncbi:MAG: hypothetical protein WAZ18_00560, partial [Alphaproteobacteria bacterium]
MFYFRTFVPTHNPAKPYSELCISLRTSNPAHAKHLVARMTAYMADTKNKANFSTPEVRNKVLETARTYF